MMMVILLLALSQTPTWPVVGMDVSEYPGSKVGGLQDGVSLLSSSYFPGAFFVQLALPLGHDFLFWGTRRP